MDENENIDLTKHPLGTTYDGTQLSDVIEVIKETDPDFRENPKGGTSPMMLPQPAAVSGTHSRRHPTAQVRIIEQPASKALRFRYECEGRSAGSIPGASSTPENKRFPEIQVFGYQGRAVVVVSCVTKDPPYLVHPHNLVGKDGCKNGVCTTIIPPETMTVQFQNLGIQCVKKRDIESSLRQREQIRVDPFRNGYAHRNQPTSIDLNAVRLCFQVFLEGDREGKFTVPLRPVVSDIIYDKKAMADLSIIKLSDCVSYVDGGQKDIVLLCEKVAKEDIEVHFYEEDSQGNRVWHAKADFQPSQVHKQHAIWFRTPRYKSLDISEPVKVFIQLYRPSDRVTSEPLPFELLPLDSGRPPYWSYKRGKKPNYELFNSILGNDVRLIKRKETNNNEPSYAEVKKSKIDEVEEQHVQIIDQVAELDEIYQIKHFVSDAPPPLPQEESFDDSRTYTSLQLAFKNPVVEVPQESYEDIVITDVIPPVIEPIPPPRPPKTPVPFDDDTPLPPLPPKRSKKMETVIGGSMSSIQLTGKQADVLLTRSGSMKSTSVSRTQSFNLQRPKSQVELGRLPPVPPIASSTLPNPKKRGFFSKLFGRRRSKASLQAQSREASVTPSFQSSKSLQVDQTLSKSQGNISTHSSNSVRIRLRDNSPPPLETMQIDLTEAENYALYTAMAPHATQIRDNKRKRAKLDDAQPDILGRLSAQNKMVMGQVMGPHLLEPIKTEPRDSTSPYGASPLYGGGIIYQNSPMNVDPPCLSPYEAPTPSPETMHQPYRQQPVMTYNIPDNVKGDQMWNILPNQQWNIPMQNQPEQVQFLDLDNHQINSGDLQQHLIEMTNMSQLPEFNNLSLTDMELNSGGQNMNMSDSLTNIVNEAAAKNLGGQ